MPCGQLPVSLWNPFEQDKRRTYSAGAHRIAKLLVHAPANLIPGSLLTSVQKQTVQANAPQATLMASSQILRQPQSRALPKVQQDVRHRQPWRPSSTSVAVPQLSSSQGPSRRQSLGGLARDSGSPISTSIRDSPASSSQAPSRRQTLGGLPTRPQLPEPVLTTSHNRRAAVNWKATDLGQKIGSQASYDTPEDSIPTYRPVSGAQPKAGLRREEGGRRNDATCPQASSLGAPARQQNSVSSQAPALLPRTANSAGPAAADSMLAQSGHHAPQLPERMVNRASRRGHSASQHAPSGTLQQLQTLPLASSSIHTGHPSTAPAAGPIGSNKAPQHGPSGGTEANENDAPSHVGPTAGAGRDGAASRGLPGGTSTVAGRSSYAARWMSSLDAAMRSLDVAADQTSRALQSRFRASSKQPLQGQLPPSGAMQAAPQTAAAAAAKRTDNHLEQQGQQQMSHRMIHAMGAHLTAAQPAAQDIDPPHSHALDRLHLQEGTSHPSRPPRLTSQPGAKRSSSPDPPDPPKIEQTGKLRSTAEQKPLLQMGMLMAKQAQHRATAGRRGETGATNHMQPQLSESPLLDGTPADGTDRAQACFAAATLQGRAALEHTPAQPISKSSCGRAYSEYCSLYRNPAELLQR